MSVPHKIMAIREERATDLEQLALLLEGAGFTNLSQIRDAATYLKNKHKALNTPGTTDAACWGYTINDLVFQLNKLPKHIHPPTIHTISISIDTKVLSKCDHWNSMNDPFLSMNFRVKLRGLDKRKEYFSGFHIDKHTGGQNSVEMHPLYHLQYNPSMANKGAGFGSLLQLDSPRTIHPPVELILGLDLVFANFLPDAWEILRDNTTYLSLQRKYQKALWQPYKLTLAEHWSGGKSTSLKSNDICPYLN